MTDNNGLGFYKFSKAKEIIEKSDSIDLKTLNLEDRNAMEVMALLLEYYPENSDEVPDDPSQCKAVKKIEQYSGAPALQKNIRNENHAEIAFRQGLESGNRDNIKALYNVIFDELEKDSSNIMIRGSPGTGKTTKAINIARRGLRTGVIDRVMTNVAINDPTGVDRWRYNQKLSKILDFSQKPGDKLLILDEISRILNQKAGNKEEGYEAEDIFGNLMPAVRKTTNGNLKVIIIGHRDDRDIIKTLRQYTNMVIYSYDREAKNKANIYLDKPQDDPRFAYDRFEKPNVKPDFEFNAFQPIRKEKFKINSNKSARLLIDTDNITKSKYPEIFNNYEAKDEAQYDECQYDDCGRQVGLNDDGYCQDHR